MPGEPMALVDRLIQRGKDQEALVARQKSPLTMAKNIMTSPAGKVGLGALGGISAAEQAQQAMSKYAEQDMPMAAAYATGALGSAITAIPHTGTQILGGALATSPLVMRAYRKLQEKGMPSGLPATYSPYFK
jgi:chaperone required for assembly of F1-ATPase